jgi:hypothetical protein
MRFSPKDQSGSPVPVTVPVCAGTSAGTIPVPPAKGLYWLAITWDQCPTPLAAYEMYAYVWQSGVPVNTFSYY